MSAHLKRAREEVNIAGPMSVDPKDIPHLSGAIWHLIQHLESQAAQTAESPAQSPATETVTSAISSAPTTGPVEKRSPSLGANPDTYRLLSVLMEQITDCFRSTPYIAPELAVTWLDSSTLQLTLRWPMPSTGTITVGGRGVASREVVE